MTQSLVGRGINFKGILLDSLMGAGIQAVISKFTGGSSSSTSSAATTSVPHTTTVTTRDFLNKIEGRKFDELQARDYAYNKINSRDFDSELDEREYADLNTRDIEEGLATRDHSELEGRNTSSFVDTNLQTRRLKEHAPTEVSHRMYSNQKRGNVETLVVNFGSPKARALRRGFSPRLKGRNHGYARRAVHADSSIDELD
ncbi:hypothetical protein AMATHDRAFT_87990 [Amanita thiersii Skay4041]|uniref:Uncharacterized protein n=1 Tax=Amanita thiersii Skay4041 TaxID=703135 RepID=A0A2A9NH45_9AGAR|nr:hypothetical protein AMATHDRAFT_87990 [Amanita thiersii Skay4041]